MTVAFVRTLILYVLIVFSLRIMGKRQIGQLQPSELVVTILISNLAAVPIEETTVPLISGVIPILTLVSIEVIISCVTLKNKKLRQIISGEPRFIIKDGKIDQRELAELRFSIDDLFEELRALDIYDVSEVEYAVVETTGKVNAYKKFEYRELENGNMISETKKESMPFILIEDGKFNYHGLMLSGVCADSVKKYLKGQGVEPENVFLLTGDKYRNMTLIKKEK